MHTDYITASKHSAGINIHTNELVAVPVAAPIVRVRLT